MDKQNDRVSGVVPLNEKRKEYWIQTKSNTNCSFFLSAKDLTIAWGDDDRYWSWSKISEDKRDFDIAKLKAVCWLDVSGKFDTTKLSAAGITYEVAFIIKLEEQASHSVPDEQPSRLFKKKKKEKEKDVGWDIPVNVKLILPDGNIRERKENLKKKPRGVWIEILVSEFVASPLRTGEIKFSIDERDGRWKKGLIVKGVEIRPMCEVLEPSTT